MNINASNHSLPNTITRTLMGKKEKRPTFEEVDKTLSKNSAKMNARMPLNSSLTNEQMFRCYVQNKVLNYKSLMIHLANLNLITY